MSEMRTPAKRINRLGSAKTGTGHFITQRVSAVALIFALPFFTWCFANSGAPDADAARAFFGSPWGAILSLITLAAGLYHMRLGLQVVIEDYVAGHGKKVVFLIANTLITYGLLIAGGFSILSLALA